MRSVSLEHFFGYVPIILEMTTYFRNNSTVDSVNGVSGNVQNINNIRALKMFLLSVRIVNQALIN